MPQRRRAAFLLAAAFVAGCSSEPEDTTPPQLRAPAAAYFPPEVVPWGVNSLSCEMHEIDWDDTGTRPESAPGEPDLAYSGEHCFEDWFSDYQGSAMSIVRAGAFLTPAECHRAATVPGVPDVLREETGADILDVLQPGTAVCVVTDRGRVVRARIDDVDPPDHQPTFRGEATVWTPKPAR
ncbi:hypothetical protein LZ318_25940 [Saccharopolyspora indica]|uniref:hypothetical protein n=1 Tax=Saccharopolyspora indica TaxID=1229659 RepID=UPI0022EAA512|nr:hypothetical protein [Saccharopolyspora indica]MDA3646650.1 hypothetical protein [Saccharopolyspora indica]